MEAAAATSIVFPAVGAARHCDHGAQTKMGLQPLLVTILVLRAKTVAFCSLCSPSASRRVYTGSTTQAVILLQDRFRISHNLHLVISRTSTKTKSKNPIPSSLRTPTLNLRGRVPGHSRSLDTVLLLWARLLLFASSKSQ